MRNFFEKIRFKKYVVSHSMALKRNNLNKFFYLRITESQPDKNKLTEQYQHLHIHQVEVKNNCSSITWQLYVSSNIITLRWETNIVSILSLKLSNNAPVASKYVYFIISVFFLFPISLRRGMMPQLLLRSLLSLKILIAV